MARLVVTCPQAWHEEYVKLFNAWCVEMDKRYEKGQVWISDHNACLTLKKNALRTSLMNIRAFRDEFKRDVGGWVNGLGAWLRETRAWLATQTAIITDGGGDPNMTTDWQIWLDDMEAWIQTVKDWYADVELILNEMAANWNTALTEWENANDEWTTAMESWINSWPVGVPA